MATASERYFLYLVNEDREAAGVQPLSYDAAIAQTASNWTQNLDATDAFYHDNPDSFYGQYAAAGMQFPSGSFSFGVQEVIGAGWTWSGGQFAAGSPALQQFYSDALFQQYLGSPVHRDALRNPDADRIGSALDTGSYHDPGNGDSAIHTARTWGDNAATHEVTGILFKDADADSRYDIGEGRSGSIDFIDLDNGDTFHFALDEGGGFDWHNVAQGTYSVQVARSDGAHTLLDTVTVGAENVDLTHALADSEFRYDQVIQHNGKGEVYGTIANDTINGTGTKAQTFVVGQGHDTFNVGAGSDVVYLNKDFMPGATYTEVHDNGGPLTFATNEFANSAEFLAATHSVGGGDWVTELPGEDGAIEWHDKLPDYFLHI